MYRELKTNDGMLPQSRSLESRVADNRGVGRNGSGNTAAMQQSRGESSANARTEPQPASAVNGVSRIVLVGKCGFSPGYNNPVARGLSCNPKFLPDLKEGVSFWRIDEKQ